MKVYPAIYCPKLTALSNVTFHWLTSGLYSWQLLDVAATYYIFTVFLSKNVSSALEGDKYIQNVHLGGILSDIHLEMSVKLNFQLFIRRYSSSNESYHLNDPPRSYWL